MSSNAQALEEMRQQEMCDHMKALLSYCREHHVYFGGCGDCGSAWLTCKTCARQVDEAHQAFDEYYGGHE